MTESGHRFLNKTTETWADVPWAERGGGSASEGAPLSLFWLPCAELHTYHCVWLPNYSVWLRMTVNHLTAANVPLKCVSVRECAWVCVCVRVCPSTVFMMGIYADPWLWKSWVACLLPGNNKVISFKSSCLRGAMNYYYYYFKDGTELLSPWLWRRLCNLTFFSFFKFNLPRLECYWSSRPAVNLDDTKTLFCAGQISFGFRH